MNNKAYSISKLNFRPIENKKYFSTFISGFEKVIKELIVNYLDNIKIYLLLDGLIVYSTTSSIEKVRKLRFLNNSFLLLKLFDKDKFITIEKIIKQVLDEEIILPVRLPRNWRRFRIITSCENRFISVNNRLIADFEEIIRKNFGLKPNRRSPQVEFWFLSRREGYGFFGMRLYKKQDYSIPLEKGELRPELANLLCEISQPSKNDYLLDPFAGSGAISIERARSFLFKQILAGDNNNEIVKRLKAKVRYLKLSIKVENLDALKLENIPDNSIDKIVTDPPWGYLDEKLSDLKEFYTDMLDSFYRILRKNGIAVLLIGERDLFENLLEKCKEKFTLGRRLYILVSGKKAGVYKLVKN